MKIKIIKLIIPVIMAIFLTQGCLKDQPDIRIPAPAPVPEQSGDVRQISQSLEKEIGKFPGVKESSVIIFGQVAIIGIIFDSNNQTTNEKIKGLIIDFAQRHPRINQALTTSEPDVVARIEGISSKVKNGRPITDFFKEIGEILSRLN